tara:strand:+ start:3684 stop:5255 length:1572 start_codon:yes stop_codon:yes gene_type:complete
MTMTVSQVVKRSASAWSDKTNWESVLRDAYEFALPMRNQYEQKQKGAPKMDRVFDATAINSTQRFGARMQAGLTPPFQDWADLEPGPLVPKAIEAEVRAKLQAIKAQLFAAIHVSNFASASAEYFLDLAAGTAAMLVMEGDDNQPIMFNCVPNVEIAIDEGPFGTVDGVFRRFELKVRNIKRQWKDATVPEELTIKESDDDPERTVRLIEATYYDIDQDDYVYQVIWKEAGDDSKGAETELVNRRFADHPWIITRWIKAPGEVWGRGPLLMALPDIKTLNKVKELVLKNASLAIAGVWAAADDGVINTNTIKITPGAVIPVAAQGNLQPLEIGGRFDVAQLVISDLRDAIKTMLFDRSLPPETGGVRSATEIIQKVKELQQDIGAPFGRMMAELVRPLIQRCLSILHRKGILEQEVKVNGLGVAITVTSPLARLQSLNDLEAVVQWLQVSAGVTGQQGVGVGAKIEDVTAWIGAKLGVPQELIRTPEERKKLQQIAGQAAAAGAEIPIGQPANDGGGSIPIAA